MTDEECITQLERAGYAVSRPATLDELTKRAINDAYSSLDAVCEHVGTGGRTLSNGHDMTAFMLKRLRAKVNQCIKALPEDER